MKVTQFKNLLKECMREVLKEEFIPSLVENKLIELKQPINQLEPQNKKPKKESNSSDNPLIDLLNETKSNMTGEDWQSIGNFKTDNVSGFSGNIPNPMTDVKVGTVNDMLVQNKGVQDINQVDIDVVPDFSNFMKVLNKSED